MARRVYQAYVGESGVTPLQFRRNGTAYDLSGVSSLVLTYQKPSGDTGTFEDIGIEVVTATDGDIEITWDETSLDEASTEDVPGDADVHWTVQFWAAVGEAPAIPSDPIELRVGTPIVPTEVVTDIDPTTAALLQAALEYESSVATADAPRLVRLRPGEWILEAPVVLEGLSNLIVECDPRTRFVVDGDWSGSGVDTATNAMFRFEPTVGASTTLSATARKGSYTLSTAASIAADSWIRLRGNNAADPSPGDSDAVATVIEELVRVASVSGSGPYTLTLYSSLRQHHATGKTVEVVTPCTDIEIRGNGALLDGGGDTVAVGMRLLTCERVRVDGLRVTGFSKAAFLLQQGSRHCAVTDVYNLGACNGLFHAYSSHDYEFGDVTCDPEGDRYHASGLIRGAYRSQWGCTGARVHDVSICKGSVGFMVFGDKDGEYINCSWRDLDPTEFIVRMDADGSSEWDTLQAFATGFWCGIGEITLAEYAQNCVFNNLHGEDTVTPQSADRHFQIDFHDIRYSRIVNVTLDNRGAAANMDGGIRIHDTLGCELANALIRGIRRALIFANDPATTRLSNIRIESVAADTTTNPGIYLTQATSRGLEIDQLFMTGFATQYTLFGTGGGFVTSAMFGIEIREFTGDPYSTSTYPPIGRMVLGRFTAGGPIQTAEMVTMSGGAADRIVARITAAGANQAPVMAITNAASGYCWIQDPSRNCLVITDGSETIAVGDALEGVLALGLGLVTLHTPAAGGYVNVVGKAARGAAATPTTIPTFGGG